MNETATLRKPQTHNGRPQVRIEDGYVILNDGHMWDYDIPMKDLRTLHGLEGWITHLSEKTWVTPQMLAEVRRVASSEQK